MQWLKRSRRTRNNLPGGNFHSHGLKFARCVNDKAITRMDMLYNTITSSKMKKTSSSHPEILLIVAIVLLAVVARLLPGPRTIDDAYITFRYARNILAGNGFVFNPGEHVLGTTTPLFAGLLAALGWFFGGEQAPFPIIANLLNAAFDGLTCLLWILIGRRLRLRLAGWGTALVWAIAPYSVTFAIGGLETSLVVLLLSGIIYLHLVGKRFLMAFFAPLALLTRPDALILLGPIALDRLVQRLKEKKGTNLVETLRPLGLELIIFLVPVFLWIVPATIYFGSPLPHSIAAKSLAYHLPGYAALVRLLQHYATPFQEQLTFGQSWIAVGLILYPFLYLVGARQAWKNEPCSWPAAVYPWLYFSVFAVANPLIFRWYLTPPLPFTISSSWSGSKRSLESCCKRSARTDTPYDKNHVRGSFHNRVGIGSAHPNRAQPAGLDSPSDHGLSRPAPQMAWYQLELLYRQAADSLAAEDLANGLDPPVLAAGDVGVLGYFTRMRILDTVGLNSPQSTRYYPLEAALYTINYAIPRT